MTRVDADSPAVLAGQGGGSITGNVETAGRCLWCLTPGSTVRGQVRERMPFKPSLNLAQLETYFICVSNQVWGRAGFFP